MDSEIKRIAQLIKRTEKNHYKLNSDGSYTFFTSFDGNMLITYERDQGGCFTACFTKVED